MEMEFVTSHPPLYISLILLFLFSWPFFAFRSLRGRRRSAAPLLAMLVPLLVASCGTWLGMQDILYGMVVTSTGREPWVAAGIADAFVIVRAGAWSAAGVALVALIRRHRPALDRGTIVIAALLAAQLLAAIAMAANLDPLPLSVYLVRAGAIAAAVIAVAACIQLFLVARKPGT